MIIPTKRTLCKKTFSKKFCLPKIVFAMEVFCWKHFFPTIYNRKAIIYSHSEIIFFPRLSLWQKVGIFHELGFLKITINHQFYSASLPQEKLVGKKFFHEIRVSCHQNPLWKKLIFVIVCSHLFLWKVYIRMLLTGHLQRITKALNLYSSNITTYKYKSLTCGRPIQI